MNEESKRQSVETRYAILFGLGLAVLIGLVLLVLAGVSVRAQRRLKAANAAQEVAEHAALVQNAELRSVIDNVVDSVITINELGIVQSFNAAAERMFGYATQEVIGKNVNILMPQPYHGAHDSYLRNYQKTNEAKIIGIGREVVGKKKDGATFPIDLAVSETRLPGRRLFTGIVRDITERKNQEKASAARTKELELAAHFDRCESKIMALFNSLDSPSELLNGMLDILARELDFYPSTVHLADEWGGRLDPAAAHGAPLKALMSYEWGSGLVGQAAKDNKSYCLGRASPEQPIVLQTGAGAVDATSVIVMPVGTRDGVIGVLTVASLAQMGRTEQAFLEGLASRIGVAIEYQRQYERTVRLTEQLSARGKEIARQNSELERTNRLKSEFLANMSHELRTPLNAVIGFSEVLRDGVVGEMNEQQTDYVGEIFSSGRHLLSLINDILDLSKIEAGRMVLEHETVDAQALFDNAISVVKEAAMKGGVELEVDLDASVEAFQADGRKLRQIIYNLLANAVKFTPAGGTVRLEGRRVAEQDSEMLELVVADTGIGIPAADLERIFMPFEQADGSIGRKYEGTGLGLSLVRKLAELHSGTVRAESEPGHGSRFAVRIPYLAAEVGTIAEPPRVASLTPGTNRVLLVEDDDAAAELLAAQLRAAGYEPFRVRSAEEAAAVVNGPKPALVVLDILLPGKSGWSVLQALRADPRTADVPVLIVSIVGAENHRKGISLGAAEVLQKPVSLAALHKTLEKLGFGARSGGRARVLVVDDDPRAIEVVATALESRGFDVQRASGGQEAIDILHDAPVDLMIVDLMMPEVSGFDVIAHVRADSTLRKLPILVLSAKILTLDEREMLDSNVQGLAQKQGFDAAAFVDAVRSAIASGARARPANHGSERSVEQPTVLVVEDDAPEREILRLYLEDAGYRVIPAADGREALRLLADCQPDLITLDMRTPEIDGVAFLDALGARPLKRHVPVILISGADEVGERGGLDVDACLRKPIGRHELIETLRNLGLAPGERKRILIVDDDPRAVKLLSAHLDAESFDLVAAYGGKEALEIAFSARPPHAVILDLMMPEMDGFQVIEALRSRPETRSLPIVVVTAKTLTDAERASLESSVQEIHQKGRLRAESLRDQLANLLRRARSKA